MLPEIRDRHLRYLGVIEERARPRDGDGDGFYDPDGKGPAPDKTPMPKSLLGKAAKAVKSAISRGGGRQSKKTVGHSHSHPHGAPKAAPKRRAPRRAVPSPARLGEIRGLLADARSTADLATATAVEARRITGRDIQFDFSGSDLAVAREHAEGVLRGLERFPTVELTAVRMADGPSPGSGRPAWGWVEEHISRDGASYEIVLSRDWSRPERADDYRESLAAAGVHTPRMGRGNVSDTPMGVVIHEFGHVVAKSVVGESAAARLASDFGDAHNEYTGTDEIGRRAGKRIALRRQLSSYALENDMELSAEAFADALLYGDDASELSQLIVDMYEDRLFDNLQYMTDTELLALLRAYGLSTDGDRAEWMDRLRSLGARLEAA